MIKRIVNDCPAENSIVIRGMNLLDENWKPFDIVMAKRKAATTTVSDTDEEEEKKSEKKQSKKKKQNKIEVIHNSELVMEIERENIITEQESFDSHSITTGGLEVLGKDAEEFLIK